METKVTEQTTVDNPLTELALESVVGMKLSDAIRLGSQKMPQAIGSWGDGINNACALTAAHTVIDKLGYGIKR